jgi:hypothetical protein
MGIATTHNDVVLGDWRNYVVSGYHPTITLAGISSRTDYTNDVKQAVFDSLSKQHFGGLSVEALHNLVKQHHPELLL